MDGASDHLPRPSDLSASVVRFLSEAFRSRDDLSRSRAVESELTDRCANLEASLSDLGRRLSDSIHSYAVRSEEVSAALGGFRDGLVGLRSRASGPGSDGGEGSEKFLAEELAVLAKEVARVEMVRAYAETALKLDSLIGDVEDAVSSSVTSKLKSPHNSVTSEETRLVAINSLKQIEDILTSIAKTRSRWSHLISAVDHRVDRALAVLRPQAISDHRSLLSSLGWPPPLTGSSFLTPNTQHMSVKLLNPLFTMGGDLKSKYCESFLSLCHLQELQSRRKSRQLEGHNIEISSIRQPLWVIEELVSPISLASQRHFSKWVEKPELIFALIYKITRDFVDSMDEVLQPLVDKARLVGYSCREEWISAMVTSLSTYLAKDIFPIYLDLLQDGSKISFLHLIDQMISFDKRTLSLISNTGLLLSLTEDENLQRVSVLRVFCDRPDWLDIWAEIELGEMLDKLKSAIQIEKNWNTRLQGTVLMSGSEDYNSPAVSGVVLQCLSATIDRSRPLPSIMHRASFIRLAGAPLVREFLDCLLRRCQEAEGLTALADDDALTKVLYSINAARYCDSILLEWSEDVFFVEMETEGSSIFEEESAGLREFRAEWIEKISTVILRGFEAKSRDYFRNKRHWQEKAEGGWAMSKAFVGALDYLQGKISKLQECLNEIDFVTAWRTVATAVDGLVFAGILMSGAKFHDDGVERFGGDLDVLFGVFRKWCLRPEGFFPRISEGLRLLRMEEKDVKEEMSRGKEKWLRDKGIRNLSLAEAEKIAKNRVFTR
ncbi:RINT1-like protein MAG2 [Iris pallida]|uniref:RINT1-like protein MAG2 n=1 Tax=Iris pallida TaxID=29817 RepID=A0AAX6EAW1_IRIPA|nr:RINT1-like protein MAG2 [Iris pallida]